jgi:hypothetical protein
MIEFFQFMMMKIDFIENIILLLVYLIIMQDEELFEIIEDLHFIELIF